MNFRIGHGYDVHGFKPGNHLVIGGISIPFDKAFQAHSDGDVLIHALCDALLGAAALGDIGQHFPDTDPRYRGADSRYLLRRVMQLLGDGGYQPVNADITLIAQAPRMSAHIMGMRENLAADLGMPLSSISIKATTTEKLGYIGRKEGIACHAVCLIRGAGSLVPGS